MYFFFFNDTATTEIYTLSLHDALPIYDAHSVAAQREHVVEVTARRGPLRRDRKSTRLNSSHSQISYAVFCLKKKKNKEDILDLVRPRTQQLRPHHDYHSEQNYSLLHQE